MTRWWLYRFLPWLCLWLIVAVIFVGLFTETGLRLLWSQIEQRLPPGIQVASIEGRLADEIRLRGLSVEQPGLSLSIAHGSVAWRPLSLFRGRVELSSLRVRGLRYGVVAAAEEAPSAPKAFVWPELPTILVTELDLADIGPMAQPAVLNRVRAKILHQAGLIQIAASELSLRGLPDLSLKVSVRVAAQSAQVEDSQLLLPGAGQLTFAGQLNWGAGLEAAFDLQPQGMDLRRLHPELPQTVTGQLQMLVRPETGLELQELQLSGRWRERPFSLQMPKASWHAEVASVESLRLQLDEALLEIHGNLGSLWAVDLGLKVPDLARLQAGSAGSLQLKARLDGPRLTPRASVQGKASELAMGEWTLKSAGISGSLTQQAAKNSQLQLTLRELRGPAAQLDSIQLHAKGVPSRLELHTEGQGPLLQWQARAEANIAKTAPLQLQMKSLSLDAMDLGRWELRESGPIRRRAEAVQFPRHCLRSAEARLCLAFEGTAEQGRGQFELGDYLLSRWPANQIEGLETQGRLQLQGRFDLLARSVQTFEASVDTSPITLQTQRDGVELELLSLLAGRGQLRYDSGGLQAQLDLPGPDASGLLIELRTDKQGRILKGESRLLLRDLEVLSLLSPEIVSASGELQARVFLAGALAKPGIRVDLALRDGELFLDTPQMPLQRMRIDAAGEWPRLNFAAEVHSGPGNLTIEGEYQADAGTGQIRVQGREFLVADSELARILIEPELQLKLQPGLLDLQGRVLIPVADIHPVSLGPNSDYVAPTEDEVILGQEGDESSPGLALRSRLRVVLGEAVRFDGFGLKTGIRGQLRLAVDPGTNPVAEGELSLVDGAYKAYGQSLAIDQGRVIFSGEGLDNPGIDLRASRRPRPEILVGIRARGRVRKPLLELWSEPEMAQTEQLSWLVLGRSGRASSEEDQASLNNAALALGLKGSDFLAARFKGKLGLDDLSIGARPGQDSQQAALVLGKYLNPRLYVSYGIGLFEPIYSFRMRYELSSKWTLQSESGVESGGDILYTIER